MDGDKRPADCRYQRLPARQVHGRGSKQTRPRLECTGARMAKAPLALAHCDVAAAVASLANELLIAFPARHDGAGARSIVSGDA